MPRLKQKQSDLKLKSTSDTAGGVLVYAEVCSLPPLICVVSKVLSRTSRTSLFKKKKKPSQGAKSEAAL